MSNETPQQEMPSEGFRRFLKIARPIFMLVGIGVLYFLVRKIGWTNFVDIMSSISPGFIALAIVAWLLNLSVAAYRFRSLTDPNLKYFKVFEVILISYLLNYASMVQGVGVGAKVGLLKGERVEVARSLAGSGAEVIFDLIFSAMVTLVFALYVGFSESGLGAIHHWPFVLGAALGFGALFAIILLGRLGGFWARFVAGLKEAMSIRRFIPNMIYTAGIQFFSAAGFYLMLRAAGAELNPLLALAAISVGFVFGLVSLVPGGLGVRDYVWAYICTLGGISLHTAATAALLMRFINIAIVALLVAVWGLVRKRLEG